MTHEPHRESAEEIEDIVAIADRGILKAVGQSQLTTTKLRVLRRIQETAAMLSSRLQDVDYLPEICVRLSKIHDAIQEVNHLIDAHGDRSYNGICPLDDAPVRKLMVTYGTALKKIHPLEWLASVAKDEPKTSAYEMGIAISFPEDLVKRISDAEDCESDLPF